MAKRSRTAAERAGQMARLHARPARSRMLAAARELATARGYESIRVGDIAAAAGVSRETFYTHFADKRSCVAEATAPRLGEIETKLRIAAEEQEPWAGSILASLEATLEERYGSNCTPRGRIIEALLGLVAEQGYGATRLADVIKAAKVSYPTFYRHFESKGECLAAAYELLIERLADRLAVRAEEGRGGKDRLVSLAEILADEPKSVRVLALEANGPLVGVGDASLDQGSGLARLLGAETDDGPEPPSPFQAGAFTELLRHAALAGELHELPARVSGLVQMLAPVAEGLGPAATGGEGSASRARRRGRPGQPRTRHRTQAAAGATR